MIAPNYYHIGMPKAGSTSIQYVLLLDDRVNLLLKPRFFNTEKWWYKTYPEVLNGKMNIISDEGFFRQFHNHVKPGVTLFRIKQINPNAQFILVIREQVSLLKSRYKHGVRHGLTKNFDEWLISSQGMDFISLCSYGSLVRSLLGYFPVKNIHILFFEDLKKNYEDFFNQFYGILSLSPPTNLKDENVVQNKGFKEKQLRITKTLNRYRIFRTKNEIDNPFNLRPKTFDKTNILHKLEDKVHLKISTLLSLKVPASPSICEWGNNALFSGLNEDFRINNLDLLATMNVSEEKMKKLGYLL